MQRIVDFHLQYFWPLCTLHRKFVYNDIPDQAYLDLMNATRLIVLSQDYDRGLQAVENAYVSLAADLLTAFRKRADLAIKTGLMGRSVQAYNKFVGLAEQADAAETDDFAEIFNDLCGAVKAYEAIDLSKFLLHGNGEISNLLQRKPLKNVPAGLAISDSCIKAAQGVLSDVFENVKVRNLLKHHEDFAINRYHIPQPKNEIRNGLSHIIRGFCGDQDRLDVECKRAEGHFNRAYLDTCKISAYILDVLQMTLISFESYCRKQGAFVPDDWLPTSDDIQERLKEFFGVYFQDHAESDKNQILTNFRSYIESRYDLVFEVFCKIQKDQKLGPILRAFNKDETATNGKRIIEELESLGV